MESRAVPVPSIHDCLSRGGLKDFKAAFDSDGWDELSLWKTITRDDLTAMNLRGGHMAKFYRMLDRLQKKFSFMR